MFSCGQIHKQWIGTGLLLNKTEAFIFLEIIRSSEYWIPFLPLIKDLKIETKYKDSCKPERCF